MTSKAQATKAKNWQVGLHQTRRLLHTKEIINRVKTIHGVGEFFASHIFDKRLISKIYEEPLPLNSKKTNNLVKN